MKSIFANLALFVILTIGFSGLTSCTGTANSEKGLKAESPEPVNGNLRYVGPTAPGDSNNAQGETKSSEYPPPPSVLTEADIKSLDGSTFKIPDRKGQVLLLNLWATWCGPCRGEMPELVAMQNKYGDQNFKVIGLNTDDESVDQIKEFADELKLNYELAWGDRKMITSLMRYTRFDAIPQSLLIDRDGRLRGVFLGGGPRVIGQMKQTVEKVMSE